MTIVNKAVLRHRNGKEQSLSLLKIESGVFRWITDELTKPWDGIDYLDRSMAIKALRVRVETDPAYVGADLTITSPDPTPAERAAAEIIKAIDANLPIADTPCRTMAEIIDRETNLPALLDSFQTLMAYVFTRRLPFAMALFPTTAAGKPRDLVMDGLLLNAIEAIEKSTGQTFDSLRKQLEEPVSNLIVAHSLPKGAKTQ
jgi:hypothetical protein